MTPQERSAQQTAALARANHIRSTRSRILTELQALPTRESAAMAVDLLRNPPAEFIGLKVERLLRYVHDVGPKRMRAVMLDVTRCAPGAIPRVGELTCRQQDSVRVFLERHGRSRDVKGVAA